MFEISYAEYTIHEISTSKNVSIYVYLNYVIVQGKQLRFLDIHIAYLGSSLVVSSYIYISTIYLLIRGDV